jgi:hypothetical protein
MPDVVNFEKELRRGHVRVASLLTSERGEEKTDTAPKVLTKGKKRASIQLTMEDVVSSDGEPERKKRRRDGAKVNDRSKERDDDDHADVTGASSQGSVEILSKKGGTKVAKAKKPPSFRDSRQVESTLHRLVLLYLTGHSDKSVRILATQVALDENEEKVWLKSSLILGHCSLLLSLPGAGKAGGQGRREARRMYSPGRQNPRSDRKAPLRHGGSTRRRDRKMGP